MQWTELESLEFSGFQSALTAVRASAYSELYASYEKLFFFLKIDSYNFRHQCLILLTFYTSFRKYKPSKLVALVLGLPATWAHRQAASRLYAECILILVVQ